MAERQPWFLYVVECAKDGSLYTGISNNVTRRVEAHNRGKGAKYTRSRRPVKLLAQWEFPDRSSASKAEYRFKKLSRQAKLKQIAEADDPDAFMS